MSDEKKKRLRAIDVLWIIPAIVAAGASLLAQGRAPLVETIHARGLFPVLSRPVSWLTSRLPFSLTEMLLIAGVLLVLVLTVALIIRLIRVLLKRPGAAWRFPWKNTLRAVLYSAAIGYLMFTLLHGLNYARLPVAESFGLPARPRSTEDLAILTEYLAKTASQARLDCEEDEQGIFRLRDGVSATLRQTSDGYRAAAQEWPLLSGPATRPKGVLLSHYWSYTGITGIYFPFLVEANVNIDQPHYTIPDTAGHELAHTRGFAREDEAGFISFLAGIHHPNPDFRYSVLANTYVRCANALYDQDPDLYFAIAEKVSEGMSRDLADNSRYWKQFEGPVAEVSETVNNAYLKANQQTDGVRSYGRMIDLVLAFFEFKGGQF